MRFIQTDEPGEDDFLEGAQEKAVEAATNLLKLKKLTVEQISSTIGLHLEQVIELKKQIRIDA